jgi:FHA domain
MAVVAIEIDDAGVTAIRDGAEDPVTPSPGYALYDRKGLTTGWAAAREARLLPRNCCTRFWDQLDRAPLREPFPHGLTHADLAHAHLRSVWNEMKEDVDRAILLVPPWYTESELALLLGISRACGIPVTGMVDSTLAASLGVEGDSAIHLDIHLHRATAVRVTRADRLRRGQVRSDEDIGLIPLMNSWAGFLSEKLVQETGFDPLHSAPTEQRLYDSIPGILDSLREKATETMTLESVDGEHSIGVERNELAEVASSGYRSLLELAQSLTRGDQPALRISSRLAGLPGFAEMLAAEVGPDVVPLPPGIASQSVLRHRNHLPHRAGNDGAIPFVVSLALEDPSADAAVTPQPGTLLEMAERPPTHILWEGVAHSIDPEPFSIGIAIGDGSRGLNLSGAVAGISRRHCSIRRIEGRVVVEDYSRYGSYLNGRRVEGKALLRAGDRLRLGTPGIEIQLIEVRS